MFQVLLLGVIRSGLQKRVGEWLNHSPTLKNRIPVTQLTIFS